MNVRDQTQMAFVKASGEPPFVAGRVAAKSGTVDWTPVVVPNVEILEVGERWRLSSGPRTFTAADLAAAVAAQDDPAIHSPILKLGHEDPRNGFDPERDGTPCFGKAINLRTKNDGMTLVADFAGVPKWMADSMPTAWPTRSIEGGFEYVTATGNTHPFVVTAVALLAEGPGIETLEDLPLALGLVAASDACARSCGQVEAASAVMASVSYEDVRKAYHDIVSQLADGYAWWIRELVVDPPELIVCDPSDALWSVTYTIKGQDVTFAEPVAVRVEYVAASAPPTRDGVTVFASREQSRNETPSTETPEGASMDLTALRTRLGVPADMPDDEVLSLAVTRLPGGDIPAPTDPTVTPTTSQAAPSVTVPAEPASVPTATETAPSTLPTPAGTGSGEPPAASPEAPAPGFVVPPGMVLVDAAAFAEVQAGARSGAQVAARVAQEDMDRFMERVVQSGRLHPDPERNPELRQVLATAYRRNPEEASLIAQNMAVVFSTVEAGHAGNGDGQPNAADSAWNSADIALFPELSDIRKPQNGRG